MSNEPTNETMRPEEMLAEIEASAGVLETWAIDIRLDALEEIYDGTHPGGLPLLKKLHQAFRAAAAVFSQEQELCDLYDEQCKRWEEEWRQHGETQQ